MLSITVLTENDAFANGNVGPEVARILREFADHVQHYVDLKALNSLEGIVLFDTNGNRTGSVHTGP